MTESRSFAGQIDLTLLRICEILIKQTAYQL